MMDSGKTLKTIAQGAFRGIQFTGKIVGNTIENVGESRLYLSLVDKLGINWLFERIIQVDINKVTAEVNKLKEKYPSETPDQLAERITTQKAVYSAGIGFISGIIPGNIPAILFDLVTTIGVQAELIYSIALIYGMDLSNPVRKGEVLTLIAMGAGSTKTAEATLRVIIQYSAEKMGTAIAKTSIKALSIVAGEKIAKRFIAKLVPIIGGFIGAGLNLSVITLTGKASKAFYSDLSTNGSLYEGIIADNIKKLPDLKENNTQTPFEKTDEITLLAIIYFLKESNTNDNDIVKSLKLIYPDILNEIISENTLYKMINENKFDKSLLNEISQPEGVVLTAKMIIISNNLSEINQQQRDFITFIADKFNVSLNNFIEKTDNSP